MGVNMQDENCIFCKIATGQMESDTVFQDELITVFRDINPAAPVHLLIIPNEHIPNNNSLGPDKKEIAAHMLTSIPKLAQMEGIEESGYRLVMNNGPDGRQEVQHIHLHLMGGQRMQHPMG